MFTNRLATAAGGLALLLLLTGCSDADDGADRSRREPTDTTAVAPPESPSSPGGRMARELGCGACHADLPGADTARERAPAFGDAGRGYEPGFLLSYLQDPGRVRADIGRSRMPDFRLSEAESLALSLFLLDRSGRDGSAGTEFRRAREAHPEVDVGLGRRIFRGLNCAGCHRGTDVEPWSAGPSLRMESLRARPGWLEAWLAEPGALRPFGFHPGTGSRMPDFRLTDAEADTLAAYLLGRGAGEVDTLPGGDPADLSAFERQKAGTLLRDRHSCLGCHRLDGDGGRLGPTLEGVAERRPDGYLRQVVAHPDSASPGTVMPRISMTSERRRLLVGYLAGLDSAASRDTGSRNAAAAGTAGRERGGYLSLVEHPPRAPTRAERVPGVGAGASPTGESLYRRRCASCHGTEGSSDGFNARYLPTPPAVHASADSMSRRPDYVLFDGVWAGGRVLDRSHRMPPFGGSLTREQAWSLVDHIRELCDCRGPEWGRGER